MASRPPLNNPDLGDDVTLARNIAAKGFKVGFLDGANVLKVRMYDGFWDTWDGWGRSLDLKEACSKPQLWGDLGLLFAVQGMPLPIVLFLLGWLSLSGETMPLLMQILLGLNGFLVAIRIALCAAIAPSYDLKQAQTPWVFWLSPFADFLAVIRLFLSATRKPQQWRGRIYLNP